MVEVGEERDEGEDEEERRRRASPARLSSPHRSFNRPIDG